MKKNVGSIDKIVRLVGAAVLVLLFAFEVLTGVLGYVALAVAAVFTITALVNFCPLWAIFGINTCKKG